MKNDLFNKLSSKIKIKVEGKNIIRFIKRMHSNRIDLLDIKYPKKNSATIVIYKKDYEKLLELKTIYNVKVIGTSGMIHIKKVIKKNNILILLLIIGISILYFLSHIIYEVEIIHTSSEFRNMLNKELINYGIKEKSFKKSYKQIQIIKKQILEHHKLDIEWLEIEVVGTKYIVRAEERKIKKIKTDYKNRNIVAKKSAIIKHVIAKSGEIVKFKNDYVKKGETVISGEIKLNDEVKNVTQANGKVYGEVWYKVFVEYPYTYFEKIKTGRKKKVLVFNFLNKHFELSFNHFKYKNTISKKLFSSILPISFTLDLQEEVKIKSSINTSAEAIMQAKKQAREKIESKLKNNEHIIDQKNLKVELKESTISIEEFFTVYEDITEVQEME